MFIYSWNFAVRCWGLWGFGRGGGGGGGGVGRELGLPISGWCFPCWRPGDGHLISIIILEPD